MLTPEGARLGNSSNMDKVVRNCRVELDQLIMPCKIELLKEADGKMVRISPKKLIPCINQAGFPYAIVGDDMCMSERSVDSSQIRPGIDSINGNLHKLTLNYYRYYRKSSDGEKKVLGTLSYILKEANINFILDGDGIYVSEKVLSNKLINVKETKFPGFYKLPGIPGNCRFINWDFCGGTGTYGKKVGEV